MGTWNFLDAEIRRSVSEVSVSESSESGVSAFGKVDAEGEDAMSV